MEFLSVMRWWSAFWFHYAVMSGKSRVRPRCFVLVSLPHSLRLKFH